MVLKIFIKAVYAQWPLFKWLSIIMKNLWLDIGNTRLKYWITQEDQILEQGAELHLQSPADLLLGLIQHF